MFTETKKEKLSRYREQLNDTVTFREEEGALLDEERLKDLIAYEYHLRGMIKRLTNKNFMD